MEAYAPQGGRISIVAWPIGTHAAQMLSKDVFRMLLACPGFQVDDLGVDGRRARFVDVTEEKRPDTVGLSGLLAGAYASMQETVTALRTATVDWQLSPRIIIGGGQVDGEICQRVGADAWRFDAMDGVRLCQRLMADHREAPSTP